MAKPELTPWFPGRTRPKRPGVYETTCGYQHWNGAYWGFFCGTPHDAFMFRRERSNEQSAEWRGLASKPKESA